MTSVPPDSSQVTSDAQMPANDIGANADMMCGALRQVALQRHREATGDQAEMRARHRAEAVAGDVEGDQRRLAAVLDHRAHGAGSSGSPGRLWYAFGQLGAEAQT